MCIKRVAKQEGAIKDNRFEATTFMDGLSNNAKLLQRSYYYVQQLLRNYAKDFIVKQYMNAQV